MSNTQGNITVDEKATLDHVVHYYHKITAQSTVTNNNSFMGKCN